MARLTLEELQKDSLFLLDFERLNSMGVDASEVWGFICRVLDFCDDEHFNSKAKSMFSMYGIRLLCLLQQIQFRIN